MTAGVLSRPPRPPRPQHRTGVRLVPAAVRPWAWLLLLAATAGVAVLGAHYRGGAAAGRVDTAIDGRVAFRLAGHELELERLIRLGSPKAVVVVALLLALLAAVLRPGRAVVFAAVSPPLAGLLADDVLKPLVDRTREGALAFPSGHTTGAFSLALVACVILLDPGRLRLPGVLRAVVGLAGLALAAGTATALVALGFHYATDTLGGVGTAVIAVLGTALLLDAALPDQPAAVDT